MRWRETLKIHFRLRVFRKARVMGTFDNLKAKLKGLVDKNSGQIADGMDKAGEFINARTGRKHSDKIDTGTEKLTDVLDGLDGKKDDFPDRDVAAQPADAPVKPAKITDPPA